MKSPQTICIANALQFYHRFFYSGHEKWVTARKRKMSDQHFCLHAFAHFGNFMYFRSLSVWEREIWYTFAAPTSERFRFIRTDNDERYARRISSSSSSSVRSWNRSTEHTLFAFRFKLMIFFYYYSSSASVTRSAVHRRTDFQADREREIES